MLVDLLHIELERCVMRISSLSIVLVLFVLLMGASVAAQDSIDPDASPNFATLQLGGTDVYWLDPTLVSVVGGVLQGESLNANTLGEGCTGIIPVAPDVVINWKEDTTIDRLRIFFLGGGDATMVISTPDGTIMCNDDVNPLVLNPMIEIENPASGSYAIFMGSFDGEAIEPGFVVVTSTDLTPATLDLTALVPPPNPDAIPEESLPLNVLLVNSAPLNDSATSALEAGFGTTTQDGLTSDGSLPAYNIELGNSLCTGFVDAVPTYVFTWTGESETLRIFFEGDNDSTLLVLGPDGSVTCNDDFGDAENLNPLVSVSPVEGRYVVYIGSFAPGSPVNGSLTISESADGQPDALTAADLPN